MDKKYDISFVRLLALFMIITCHIMQFYNYELAWWFNVGVQIFLIISGYLYSTKRIANVLKFYIRNFVKILLDYYVLVIGFLILLYVTYKQIDIDLLVGLFTLTKTIKPVNHLWFIPYILFCYLLVPFFSYLLDKLKKKWWILILLLLDLIFRITNYALPLFNPAWINAFLIGMMIMRIEKADKDTKNTIWFIIYIVAFLTNTIQIVLDYVVLPNIDQITIPGFTIFKNYSHVLLGLMLFDLFRKGYTFLRINKWFLDLSDKYSYDIYLVHQIIILGEFSILSIIPIWVGIPLCFILSIFLGVALYYCCKILRKEKESA